MKDKVMSSITITEKIKSLPRHERLFCALFNKYRWLSEPNKHPLTTYRSFDNPNQLDLEFELIEIDNYLMAHAKDNNVSRIWYKDSWITGIEKWLKNTKRAKINPNLFVSIGDMIPKEEEPEEELTDFDKFHDAAISLPFEDVYCADWDKVKKYILGDLTKGQLVGIWWSPLGKYLKSRVMKAKSMIKHHKQFCGWIYADDNLPQIVGTYIIGIWIGIYDVEILEDDFPPKKKVPQPEEQPTKLIGSIPEDMIPSDDNIISITELKEQLISRLSANGEK